MRKLLVALVLLAGCSSGARAVAPTTTVETPQLHDLRQTLVEQDPAHADMPVDQILANVKAICAGFEPGLSETQLEDSGWGVTRSIGIGGGGVGALWIGMAVRDQCPEYLSTFEGKS